MSGTQAGATQIMRFVVETLQADGNVRTRSWFTDVDAALAYAAALDALGCFVECSFGDCS